MTALTDWAVAFLAETGLDTTPADGHGPADTGAPNALDRTQPRIPARYAAAITTDPGVRSWLAEVARRAVNADTATAAVTTGPSLLLLGATGTGKTYEAYGALRCLAACEVYAKWRFTTAPDLYAMLRPRPGVDSEAEFQAIAQTGLLVVDDFGAAKNSEWVEEINYRLINHRYEHVLPTLFTSNVLPKDLAGALGDRVASRLTEMIGRFGRVSLKGDDRRYP